MDSSYLLRCIRHFDPRIKLVDNMDVFESHVERRIKELNERMLNLGNKKNLSKLVETRKKI